MLFILIAKPIMCEHQEFLPPSLCVSSIKKLYVTTKLCCLFIISIRIPVKSFVSTLHILSLKVDGSAISSMFYITVLKYVHLENHYLESTTMINEHLNNTLPNSQELQSFVLFCFFLLIIRTWKLVQRSGMPLL